MAVTNNILNIGGTELAVASYEFNKMELDIDSGRNLNGVLERNILSHHPRKIMVTFPPMSQSDMENLLSILDNSTLTVSAYNPFTGAIESNIKMYHGDLKPKIYWKVENLAGDAVEVLYYELQVELVEY